MSWHVPVAWVEDRIEHYTLKVFICSCPCSAKSPDWHSWTAPGQLLFCETQPCIVHRAGQGRLRREAPTGLCRTQSCVTWPAIMALAWEAAFREGCGATGFPLLGLRK